MKITYQVETVEIPRSKKTTGRKRTSPVYNAIETLLGSNLSTSIAELDNNSQASTFYVMAKKYINDDALPIRIARRGLSVYMVKEA